MTSSIRFLAAFVFALVVLMPSARSGDEVIVATQVKGDFQDYRDRLVFAIEQQGLTIANTAKVGAMMARTGKDLGAQPAIGEAEVVEFCSASLSLQMTAADPRLVAFCPYAITVYTVLAEPGTVHFAYRRPWVPGAPDAVASILKRAETLLADIVRTALE